MWKLSRQLITGTGFRITGTQTLARGAAVALNDVDKRAPARQPAAAWRDCAEVGSFSALNVQHSLS